MTENSGLRFDLFDIIKVGLKWKKMIIGISITAALVAAVFFFFQKTYYKAYGHFFPASAVMSGRINLFRESNQDWIDFFGGENELDRAYVIGNSANVVSHLIEKYKMADHYKIDVKNDPQGNQKVYKRFAKNYGLNRSGFKHLEVTFMDENSDLASQIVNEAMNKTESEIRKLYENVNRQLSLSLDIRMDSVSKDLTIMTDSLANLRVKYGIYDLIAPGRKNLISSQPKGSGLQYAQGLEVIQNIEEVKNKLTMDKAKYMSLSNEFKAASFDGFPMIHVTQWSTPGGPKAGPMRILGVLATFAAAFIFSLLVSIVVEILKTQKARFQ